MTAFQKIMVMSWTVLFLSSVGPDCKSQQSSKIFNNPFQNIEELAITSENCILEGRHLWISSELQTVNPDFSGIGGISQIFSPPLNLSPFQLQMKFFNKKIAPEHYIWKPGEIIQEGKVNGIEIKCLLVPAWMTRKIIQIVELTNRSKENITIPVSITADPYLSYYDSQWGWSPGKADKVAAINDKDTGNGLCFVTSDGSIRIKSDNTAMTKLSHELSGEVLLGPNSKKHFAIIVSYTGKHDSDQLDNLYIQPSELITQSRKRWNERLEDAYNHLGRIKTSNPEFDLFYKRGILSLLTCEWNIKEMLLQPYFSESGIDGGAFCSYMWGYAYISRIMPLYKPEAWKAQIVQAIKTDATNHYAFTPITGEGVGPWYSYNQYSVIRAIYDYVLISGDHDFLSEIINNRRVIDYCIEQALYKDDITQDVRLINYGTNMNLLELKKTGTYQFFVPSPNAERCWSYRAVDELCRLAKTTNLNLSIRADNLANLITKELWSYERNWFMTIDTLGIKHFSPSIQIFDLMRCKVMSKEQEEKILNHLNKYEFLSNYGVHSLSKDDQGYDLNDADWGGPGVYTGDAPELIEDLYLSGYPEKAEDLITRILWWGKHFPYYPQSILAGDIDYRRNGRANIITGISTTQSILFGILDLKFTFDGKVSIKPRKVNIFSNLKLDGLMIKGKNTNLSIHENNISVTIDGNKIKNVKAGERIYF